MAWRRTVAAGALYLAMLASPVGAQSRGEPRPADDPPAFQDLSNTFRQLGDWEEPYLVAAQAVQAVWERNGWTSEPDLYARDLVLDVARIPPWQINDRLDKLLEHAGERYELTPTQLQRFRQGMVWEMASFAVQHSAVITQQVGEFVSMQRSGEPFDAEDVARFTRATQPLFDDGLSRVQRFLDVQAESMTPRQRALLARDRTALDKRVAYVREARERWAAGEWNPADVGLDRHPWYAPPDDPAAGGDQPGAKPERWAAHRPETWIVFVRHYGNQYSFDRSQSISARSIHDELVKRARTYERTRAKELWAVPPGERSRHAAYEPIRRLFEELQARLAALRTAAQRSQDEP